MRRRKAKKHGTRKHRRQYSNKVRRRYCDHEDKRRYVAPTPKNSRGVSRHSEQAAAISDSLSE